MYGRKTSLDEVAWTLANKLRSQLVVVTRPASDDAKSYKRYETCLARMRFFAGRGSWDCGLDYGEQGYRSFA